jgi:unsaturated rhamnogalacturonyl hydrolase
MKTFRFINFFLSIGMLVIVFPVPPIAAQVLPTKLEVATVMGRVNDYWYNSHRGDPGNNRWARSVYFIGNMAHYLTTFEDKYLDHATNWAATKHEWQLNCGCCPINADDQAAGQTYFALNFLDPDPAKIVCIKESIDFCIRRNQIDGSWDDWLWIDHAFMAMPIYAQLAAQSIDSNEYSRYSDAMYELYQDLKIRRELFNADVGLWNRDENYKPHTFWSRGNGWIFAALARILAILPDNDSNYNEYLATFQGMAAKLKTVQRSDGFWNVDLGDANQFPGPETSGTALFTYGMALGIEIGVLDPVEYKEPAVRASNGMVSSAVHGDPDDGMLGWVQGAGQSPADNQPVGYNSTSDFGVGVFLLAGSAIYQMAPANLALNRPVVCSSEPQPENGCSHTVDANLDNRWSALGFPQWVEVDLGNNYRIHGANVHPYMDRAYQYIVEAKTADGDDFFPVVSRSGNTQSGSIISDSFTPVLARYVRLRVVGAYNYSGRWVSIREFEVFGN